jgi:hypothetical protein
VALGADQGVGAADLVAVGFKLAEGVIDPGALLGPRGDGGDAADGLGLAGDGGVKGDFHLIDGHRVGVELDGLLDGVFPLVLGLAHHPGDEVDVDLGEADIAHPFPGAEDFRRFVGPAVLAEDFVVEVLNAE